MPHARHNNLFRNTIISLIATFIFVGAPVLLSVWQVKHANQYSSPILNVKNIYLRENEFALKLLASYGFNLNQIRTESVKVPPIYFAHLPRELPEIRDVKVKKEIFLSALLPPILKVNQVISQDRKKLKKIILNITLGENVSEAEYYWLTRKMIQYKVKAENVQDFLNRADEILQELLDRINIVPPELALAQAAQESGWGTSRFSQKGNALYGEWTWGNGCGMVPKRREEGKTHRMKCFSSIIEAVDSYMKNLNTHRAYRALRAERSKFRDDQAINVTPLVETLTNYSEEGHHYVEKINRIIRVNKLTQFSKARLKNKL